MVMPNKDGQAPQTPNELLMAFLKSVGVGPRQPLTKEDLKKQSAEAWFKEADRIEGAALKDCECLSCVVLKREGRLVAMMCRAAAHTLLGRPEGFNLLVEKFDQVRSSHPECFAKPTETPS